MIDLKNLSNMSEREIWLLWVLAFIAGLSIRRGFLLAKAALVRDMVD